ncbi:MAG TPA: methyltransferase domain-containing protein [Candidatus Binataceae bacterium]|nr:methyltransferase domain-containing protein [Candidatus Binataceae bacterium]
MSGGNRSEHQRSAPLPEQRSDWRKRSVWEDRHRTNTTPAAPEPSVVEWLDLLPRGLALDVAAGAGRHSVALARVGYKVVAIDYAETALRTLQSIARAEKLSVWPLLADLSAFAFPPARFDAILNVNFLDRALVPRLVDALRPGGGLLLDTFLIDQAATGHPRNPDFMLQHYELREMLREMDLVRYREGIVAYPDGKSAWRAAALAIRKSPRTAEGA